MLMCHKCPGGSLLIRLKMVVIANIYCVLVSARVPNYSASCGLAYEFIYFFLILHENFINHHNTVIVIVIILYIGEWFCRG